MDLNSPNLLRKLVGVLKLDQNTYTGIAEDNTATSQAIVVALAGAAVTGLVQSGNSLIEKAFGFFGSLLIWIALTAFTHFVCNAFRSEPAGNRSFSRIARLTGFAQAPELIGVMALIPGIEPLISSSVGFWWLATWFTAVKVAGPFTSQATCLILILQIVCLLALAFLLLFLFLLLFGATMITFEPAAP